MKHRPYLPELVAEKRQIMRQTVNRTWDQVSHSSVTHTTWGGEDKLKKEGTVEGMRKSGRKVRAENPRHGKKGVQGLRGLRGHAQGAARNSV